MNMTYLDTDTHELIAVVDDPAPESIEVSAKRFAAGLRATIERIVPSHIEDECVIELRIPPEVRQAHMPCPGETVIFTARSGYYEQEMVGTYQFKRGWLYVICDQVGGEWVVHSLWQMKRCSADQFAE